MRYRVIFSPEADAQLVGIYRYIAGQASPMIAERFTTAIVDYWGSKPEPPKIPSADQRGLSRARSMG